MNQLENDVDDGLKMLRQRSIHEMEETTSQPRRTYLSDVWYELRRKPGAILGAGVLLGIILMTLLGHIIYSVSPTDINFSIALTPPSKGHPLGTNMLGQDLLAQMILGGRISILVGINSMLVSVVLGTTIGAVSGFFGGKPIDMILMRVTDLFLSMPRLPLLMLTVYLFRNPFKEFFGSVLGVFTIVISVIGLFSWMEVARLVRSSFLTTREMLFVKAARATGASSTRIIINHIFPNVLSPIIVAATLTTGTAILQESVLSFLGLGFPPDTPTWGSLLHDNQQYLQIAPYIVIAPGMAIFLTTLSLNSLGDGLRDALDPQQRQR